jgi:type IV secretory pathway VirJ component
MFILARSTVLFVVLLISLIAGIQSFKTTKLATSHQFRASRMNRDLHRIPAKLGDDSTKSNVASSFQDDPLQLNSIIQTSALMFLLSAPLGMMLDNYHGKQSTERNRL